MHGGQALGIYIHRSQRSPIFETRLTECAIARRGNLVLKLRGNTCTIVSGGDVITKSCPSTRERRVWDAGWQRPTARCDWPRTRGTDRVRGLVTIDKTEEAGSGACVEG